MKKVGFMIVYNDIDYVEYAIKSVKGWLDHLYVVEGAFEITMATGKPARSNDGTLEVLQKYAHDSDFTLTLANEREHKHHYDIGYQQAVSSGADWAIMIDSDEVWTSRNKMMLEVCLDRYKSAKEMRIAEWCFINDFQTWHPGTFPRVFRCEEGAKFVFDNEVAFQEGRGQHSMVTIPESLVKVHHYGYVRRKKRWQLKQDYMWEKDHNPIIKKYKLEGNTYILPDDIPIYKFRGAKHPQIMEDHPFYGKSAEEIIYGED